MSWRDNLRQASFRGAKFKVEDTTTGIGRRNVIHQFPGRDIPYVEDLGADADEFSIRGYIVQNTSNSYDYFGERDKLIEALKKSGPGTLIHPFLGEKIVSVAGKASLTETFTEGGIARFDMTFVLAGENKNPSQSLDPKQAMDDAAEDAITQIEDEMGTFYEVVSHGLDQSVSDITTGISMMKRAMMAIKGGVTSVINDAINTIDRNLTDISSTVYSACNISAFLEDSLENFQKVIGSPTPITSAIVGACTGTYRGKVTYLDGESVPQKLGKSMSEAYTALYKFGESPSGSDTSIYGGTLDAITITTTNTARRHLNRSLTVNALRNIGLIYACKVAARTEFASYEDAISVTETVVDAIDEQLTSMGDQDGNDIYGTYNLPFDNSESINAMENIRAVFVKVMAEIGANLARVVNYTVPPQMYSTLQIAYDQYEDVTREEEIYERNKVSSPHPGFLNGKTIEILSE